MKDERIETRDKIKIKRIVEVKAYPMKHQKFRRQKQNLAVRKDQKPDLKIWSNPIKANNRKVYLCSIT